MSLSVPNGPQRIVCLTEEPTEILYALGEGHRVVGISAYTVRPPEARQEKPVVSAFLDGSLKKIAALDPDLVIGFSDIQAKLAAKLIAAHLPVLIFNQRSLQEILDVIVDVGSLVGQRTRAQELVSGYITRMEQVQSESEQQAHRPSVYFEEWHDPMITGIRWVHELIEIAGGKDVFAEKAQAEGASDRIVSIDEVLATEAEIMLASWCGEPFDRAHLDQREGFGALPAVRDNRIYEIPSEIILQPGPACLTDGLEALVRCIRAPNPL
jgi:iron complex transport system substrate-binding protein